MPFEPHPDGGLLLPGESPREEERGAAVNRRRDRLDIIEFREPLDEVIAARQRVQPRPRGPLLRVHPGLHLGSFLVFEPAIRVIDLDPVQRVSDGFSAGRWISRVHWSRSRSRSSRCSGLCRRGRARGRGSAAGQQQQRDKA